ncbi:hypothetical protein AMJ85_11560 [candidate division BRC1 bacterium SM23_51]|nr:MAG: hypothetical protein AMJ85_11560 [candidate division BRC1 bacterium SM23_51]
MLHVTMVIHPGRKPYLTLYLRDTILAGACRIQGLSAKRGGQEVAHWQAIPGFADLRNVWVGFSREPIEIHYDVNPRWQKGRKPSSYLGADFGYLRGMVMLYTPITLKEALLARKQIATYGDGAGQATLQFSLPAQWTLISPWPADGAETAVSRLRNVYFGVGPMSVRTLHAGEATLLLGVYTGLSEDEQEGFLRDIPSLFEAMVRTTGVSPDSRAPYWTLTVLPHEPVSGGASGMNSLVVHNKLSTIAHEMFHWWNGRTIQTTPDANWIKEGFTTYYEGKILYAAGLWSEEKFSDYVDYLRMKLWRDREPTPIDLLEASKKLLVKKMEEEYDNVYFGGALVAHGDNLARDFVAQNDGRRDVLLQIAVEDVEIGPALP